MADEAKVPSLRDRILAAKDIEEKLVAVPQWGCEILVRGLTGLQRAKLAKTAANRDGTIDLAKIQPRLIILTAYDPETLEPVFKDTDEPLLNEKSGAALQILVQAAMELSGLAPSAVDEAEKNSSAPSESITSS